jgi:hypothetical protein
MAQTNPITVNAEGRMVSLQVTVKDLKSVIPSSHQNFVNTQR